MADHEHCVYPEDTKFVTMKTFVGTLATVVFACMSFSGAILTFAYNQHLQNVHRGALTIERYEQLRSREEAATAAHRAFIESRLTRIENKIDELQP